MTVLWVWRAIALMGLVVLMAGIGPLDARAQGPDDLDALNRQVGQLYQAGKYAEATEIAKRSLSFAEKKFGPDHPLSHRLALLEVARNHLHRGRLRQCQTAPFRSRTCARTLQGSVWPN